MQQIGGGVAGRRGSSAQAGQYPFQPVFSAPGPQLRYQPFGDRLEEQPGLAGPHIFFNLCQD
jgi:hypothetical protein